MTKKLQHGRYCRGGKDRPPTGQRACLLCVGDNVDHSSRLIFVTPLASIGFSAVIGPRVEMYTVLACRVHAPGHELQYEPNGTLQLAQSHSMLSMNKARTLHDGLNLDDPSTLIVSAQHVSLYVPADTDQQSHIPDRDQCASDPVVQAAVAQLSAGWFHRLSLYNREALIPR